jgi:hypothetical protein
MPEGPWVLVIGCHRSGTSAVTGALVALGLQGVDPSDRIETQVSNPEHAESLSAGLYDEAILARLDAAWDAPPPMASEPVVVDDEELADPAAIMAAAYPGTGPLVWKDPRACLLLPHWRRLLPGPLTVVFVWREPLGVARSLHTRDGMPLVDGLALWERYNRSAAAGLQGVDTFVVEYDHVLQDPAGALGSIADWMAGLGRFNAHADGWDVAAAAATIDRTLHHETAQGEIPDGLLRVHQGVAEWLQAHAGVHGPLVTQPPPPESLWPEAVLATRREAARWRRTVEARDAELVRRAAEHAEVVSILEALVRSRDQRIQVLNSDLEGEAQRYSGIKAELERIKGSTSWKVTAPLRAALAKLSGPGAT